MTRLRPTSEAPDATATGRRRGVGLRDRLILWLGVTIGLLFLLDATVLKLVVLPSFEQVESDSVERGFDRTLNALDGELRELRSVSGDYANWDDAYRFVLGENEAWAVDNGSAVSMAHLDLAIFAVLDGQGAIRLGRMRGGDSVIELPAELRPLLRHVARRFGQEGRDGILVTTLGPLLVSAQPIRRSDASGPPAGTLILARWLDEGMRAKLEERTREQVALWPVGGMALPEGQATSLRELDRSGAARLVRAQGGERIAVQSILRDMAGEPALLLQVERPRSTMQLGIQATRMATLGFVVSAGIALIALSLLLRRLVIDPLSALTAHIMEIRRTGDLSRPLVLATRDDEIGTLAQGFDAMRASLHEAHQELRDTFDSIGDLFFALDRELRITIANRACLETWGKRQEEVIGRPILAVLPRLEGSECVGAMQRVLATGRAERLETFSPVMQRWIEFHATARRDGGLAIHLQDITARKEAERTKGAFLATMSHEIRTPLTAILGFADLLARSPLSPEQAQHLKIVRDTGQTLLTVVNDILDLSKLEAGKMSLERIPVDLATLLKEALAASELLGAEKGLAFRLELDPALPALVAGDPVRLKQVVGNLLSNALKFTSKGGITLRAKALRREGTAVRVRVEVEDTGIGVAPEHRPRLFSMFEQADQTTTRRFGGTGLGLAICKRLVEAMGGTIGVESEPGVGSLFWFELSLERVASASPTAAAAGPVAAGRALSVLVVDDVATNRLLLKALLARLGHTVSLAEDGVGAVEAASRSRFDLILMDLHMPGMDGFMATQAIRAGCGPNAATPIVALSADVQPETAQACRAAGMDGSLAKPIEPGRLIEVLNAVATAPAEAA